MDKQIKNFISKKEEKEKKKISPWFFSFAETFNNYYQFILLALIILMLTIGLIGLVSIYLKDIRVTQQQLKKNKQELSVKQVDLDVVKGIKVDYEKLAPETKKIFQVLPYQADLPNLYVQLENLAQINGLEVLHLNFSEVLKDTDKKNKKNDIALEKVLINLKLSGNNYFIIKNYLKDLEKNIRLLEVDSLLFNPEASSFDLNLVVYYLL